MIPLYSTSSPSHDRLMDEWFVPTLKAIDPDGSRFRHIHVRSSTDHCPGGNYYADGWQAAITEKLDIMVESIRHAVTANEPYMLWSDVDVQFFGDPTQALLRWLGDADAAYQMDLPTLFCTGFWIARPSFKLLAFWEQVRETDWRDQEGMNELARRQATLLFPAGGHVQHRPLEPHQFWTFGYATQTRWEPGMKVRPPADILVHHANWTVGVDRKLALLQAVRAVWNRDFKEHPCQQIFP